MGKKRKILKIGSAQRWLERKRKEREPVKLTLERKALRLLDRFLRNPWELPLAALEDPKKQWHTKDPLVAKQVVALQKFFEKNVYEKLEEGKFQIPEKWEGSLPKSYVDRLLEITKHYEPLGGLVSFAEDYYLLRNALEGKKPSEELLEELTNYKEPEEKPA